MSEKYIIREKYHVKDWKFENGKWTHKAVLVHPDEKPIIKWEDCSIVEVPVQRLLVEYEDMVLELADKEVELYNLKEAYLLAEQKIVAEVDFKAIYGKNNADIRKQHVKNELSDMYEQMKSLEFSIAFIGRYIGLLKEVVRTKQ